MSLINMDGMNISTMVVWLKVEIMSFVMIDIMNWGIGVVWSIMGEGIVSVM